jgi:hypothetical protein
MAINPAQPYFSLPPATQARARQVAQADFTLPGEVKARGMTMEEATRRFGESIQALSPEDRKEIQIIHSAVDQWAAGKQNPDRLGQFLVRVMLYADQRLERIEAGAGKPAECQGLERVFTNGFQMVQVYAGLGKR